MRITTIIFLVFLLGAFAIGASTYELDKETINIIINNTSQAIENIELTNNLSDSEIPNYEGLMKVLEKYIHFVGTFTIEIFKVGLYFGRDNPDYFEPVFIIKIIKLIIVLVIIMLLIKPVGYLLIFLILFVMFIYDKIKNNKSKRRKNKWKKKNQHLKKK